MKCSCVYCEPVRGTPWEMAREAARIAMVTVGIPITECTNRAWCRAIDLCADFVERRSSESEIDFRQRVAKLIKAGKFDEEVH